MIDCETRKQDLKAYLDDELSLPGKARMWLHLQLCAACREELKAMIETCEKLRAEEKLEFSPALRSRILDSVSYSALDAKIRVNSRPRQMRVPIFLWGAAATGLLAGIFLRPLWMTQSDSRSPAFSAKTSSPAVSGYAVPSQSQTVSGGASAGKNQSQNSAHAPQYESNAKQPAGETSNGAARMSKQQDLPASESKSVTKDDLKENALQQTQIPGQTNLASPPIKNESSSRSQTANLDYTPNIKVNGKIASHQLSRKRQVIKKKSAVNSPAKQP